MLEQPKHLANITMSLFSDGNSKNIMIFHSMSKPFYNEEARPELFAYFVQGGPGQVLDNTHGNIYFGVANGTPCTMHSLA